MRGELGLAGVAVLPAFCKKERGFHFPTSYLTPIFSPLAPILCLLLPGLIWDLLGDLV